MIVFLLSILFAIELPQNMNKADRQEVLLMLGGGGASKFNSVPEALGGFSGVELGLSFEWLPTDKLNGLGNGVDNDNYYDYAKISLGKGLFYYTDLFVHFVPFDEKTGLAEYGSLVRWEAWRNIFNHFTVAALFHFNSSNIKDLFISDVYGTQIHITWNPKPFGFYVGLGSMHMKAKFKGGVDGLTDSGDEVTDKATDKVTIVGASLSFKKYFLAVEVNNGDYMPLTAKLGVRF